ncbi:MAG TPA: hypothetical protein VGS07_22745 [Thermoanaerobaculia bacterium]|jgi:hypothetical protein|nr:hypothetical protein [Thermoanaerobaculia bacterium]
MAILSRDTSRDAEDVQMEILRHTSPQKKAEMLRGMHRSALALTRQGLRRRNPVASGAELERLRAEVWLGRDLADRAYQETSAPLNGDLMDPLDPLAVASLVARALDDLGVLYFVGGSLASTLHGEPRFTRDADLIAELQPRHAEALAQALAGTFYADAESIHRAIARRASFNVIHLDSAFKVDIFVSKLRPFDRSSFARREPAQGAGYDVWISSAEDTLLAKLDWFREGHEVSDQQWRDILAILTVQRDHLDQGYLRTWAEALGVRDLLDRALVETNLGD